jgi:hypothetical protein
MTAVLPADLGPYVPPPAALLEARRTILGSLGRLLAIEDDALANRWTWRGERGQADVRYGFYRIYERIEEAANALTRLDLPRSRAADILGQAAAARCEFEGALRPFADALDELPGGEWSLRRTLGHVVSTQASYAVRTVYAVHRVRKAPTLPVTATDEMYQRLPVDAAGAGPIDEVLARLDDWFDAGAAWLGGVDDDLSLTAPTTWTGYEVDVRFRLHRWSSHFREHTVQVDKTLPLLGIVPREVDRLFRLLLGAYGWLEGAAIGVPLEGEGGVVLAAGAADVALYAGELLSSSETSSPK